MQQNSSEFWKKSKRNMTIKFTENKLYVEGRTDINETKTGNSLSLVKWRSAEQQVCKILNYWGYNVKDVSKQNLGYDIEGLDSDGENVYIEVKSINYFGQPFIITNNEWSAAKERGSKYIIAVVKQDKDNLEIAFLKDPLNKLEMDRKCRQWVWECTNYKFETQKFKLNR